MTEFPEFLTRPPEGYRMGMVQRTDESVVRLGRHVRDYRKIIDIQLPEPTQE